MEGKNTMSLNNEELNNINRLFSKLKSYDGPNTLRKHYIEGKNLLKDLKISIPPQLKNVRTSIGWAKICVSAIEERLNFNGWSYEGNLRLEDIYNANNLGTESTMVHWDSLSYGKGFVVLGKGNVAFGEPEVLITIEPPTKMTGEYNLRTRRLQRAISVSRNERGLPITGALYELNQTIYFVAEQSSAGKTNWIEVDRDEHNLGFVPVVEFINDRESGSTKGHSQITETIMAHINGAERTLLAMTVASEFFSAPQRYIIGTESDPFVDSDGKVTNAWEAIIGRVLALPANAETGNNPTVGQFQSNSPAPFIEQVKLYASLVSGETGIPASQLGLNNEGNPASADAIRSTESRLVKTVERKQTQFASSWVEVAKLAILIRDGELTEEANSISVRWEDAATPTIAARADAIVKYVQAGILPANSDITREKIGILTETEKEMLRKEFAMMESQAMLTNLAELSRTAMGNGSSSSEPQSNDDNGGVVDSFRDISNGSIVEFNGNLYGQVEHIMVSGILGIEGSEFAVQTSATNPGVSVRLWEVVNGEWTPTPVTYNVRYNTITVLDALPEV
jgi:hypothetical protein